MYGGVEKEQRKACPTLNITSQQQINNSLLEQLSNYKKRCSIVEVTPVIVVQETPQYGAVVQAGISHIRFTVTSASLASAQSHIAEPTK